MDNDIATLSALPDDALVERAARIADTMEDTQQSDLLYRLCKELCALGRTSCALQVGDFLNGGQRWHIRQYAWNYRIRDRAREIDRSGLLEFAQSQIRENCLSIPQAAGIMSRLSDARSIPSSEAERRSAVGALWHAPYRTELDAEIRLLPTPGFSHLTPPPTVNGHNAAIAALCDNTIERPKIAIHALKNVTLYSWGQAIAIEQNGQPTRFTSDRAVLYKALGDWSDAAHIETHMPNIYFGDIFSGGNYCHWMFDHIPRLLAIFEAFPEARDAQPILNEEASFTEDSLRMVHPSGLDPLAIPHKSIIKCETLYVASSSFQDYMHAFQRGSRYLTTLTRSAFGVHETPTDPMQKLFIDRDDTRWRNITNGEALKDMLATHGVSPIKPGQLSLQDQISAFSRASLIVAPHGAGLANLMFAPRTANIVEIFHPRFATGAYFLASTGIGQTYISMNGGKPGRSELLPRTHRELFGLEDFEIDIDVLDTFLKAL